jgi:hypothetical protein
MPSTIHQALPLQSLRMASFLWIFGHILLKPTDAFLVTSNRLHHTLPSSGDGRSGCGPNQRFLLDGRRHLGGGSSTSLREDCGDGSDTLETLSELLSHWLSVNEADGLPHDQQQQRQRELLTSRLSSVHDSDVDSDARHIYINRTHVQTSTIAGIGKGLFARTDCPEGTLLTCYPGDALVDLENTDAPHGEGNVLWGSHAKKSAMMTNEGGKTCHPLRQEYMLRAIHDDWGIVAVPEIVVEDDDPTYLGHYANDGAERPPTCESELAAYVIESADRANAVHQPCQGCHMVTVATRDVKAGEEIFVTYGPDYWREQASFVPSVSQDNNRDDDSFDDEDFDDSDFDYDCYDEEVDAIVADIIFTSDEPPESPSRGKGFG